MTAEQLQAGLLALERLRGEVEDAVLDLALAALNDRLDALRVSEQPEQRLRQATVLFVNMHTAGGPHRNEAVPFASFTDALEDTSTGAAQAIGVQTVVTATKSSDAFPLTNIGVQSEVMYGDVNFSWFSQHGMMRNDGATFFGDTQATNLKSEGQLQAAGDTDLGGQVSLDSPGRPTLTDCGEGASLSGNDNGGHIMQGVGSTGCKITFARAWTAGVACVVTAQGLGSTQGMFQYWYDLRAITVTNSINDNIDYICFGQRALPR